MVDIKRLHIHYRTLTTGKMKVKKVKPTDATNQLAIKHDIALAVQELQGKAEYYYVVIEIDRGGQSAYRTVTPKIMF